jgi:hypothetical protein
MAPRPTRHEPAWAVGNAKGTGCGRGPCEILVHRGFGCRRVHALQGRDDPRCSGMVSGHGGGRGVARHVRGRVGNGRGMEARQGAMRIFWEIPIPPSSSRARRRPRAASAPEPASTNTRCAIWRSLGPRESRGRSRRGAREGRARGIAHRMKPEWWAAGRCGGKGVQKKRGWLPAGRPSACRSRRPQGSSVRPAPADVQDTVSRMVDPPRLPAMRGVQRNPR